jgi:hypothetical protein
MADEPKGGKSHKLLVYGALGVGGVAVLYFATRGGGGPAKGSPRASSSHSYTPNPADATLEQAGIAARASAVQAYDSTILGERTLTTQQAIAFNTNRSQVEENANTNKTQLSETQLSTAAQEAIANSEEQAQITASNNQLQAAQGQQQNNWWQTILGGITSFLPFLGGSGGFTPNAANDAINQTPTLPPVVEFPEPEAPTMPGSGEGGIGTVSPNLWPVPSWNWNQLFPTGLNI